MLSIFETLMAGLWGGEGGIIGLIFLLAFGPQQNRPKVALLPSDPITVFRSFILYIDDLNVDLLVPTSPSLPLITHPSLFKLTLQPLDLEVFNSYSSPPPPKNPN